MSRFVKNILVYLVAASTLLAACAPPAGRFAGNPSGGSTTSSSAYSDYIILVNNGTRNVVLLDPNGGFVRVLLQFSLAGTDIPWGVAKFDDDEILVNVEGGATGDRVMKVNLGTGVSENYIVDGNVTGTMRGIARLSGGDILISEQNTVERYTITSTGPQRISGGAWPATLLTTGTSIAAFSSGNRFVECATGSDSTRTYTDTTATIATVTSTSAPTLGSTMDVMACDVGPNGEVGMLYSGATDAVRVYSDYNMTTLTYTYTDATNMGTPLAMAFRPDGKVLVATNNNVLLEITAAGALNRTIASSYINTINQILVMR